MKTTLKVMTLLFAAFVMSCGGKEEKKEEKFSYEKKVTKTEAVKKEEKIPASERVDFRTKGVGPITSIEFTADIDQTLATQGEEVFRKMCTACHRPNKKFIGPAPKGILERRTPEWVMNMILNPEVMVQKDPLAKELLLEFNGSPMVNQNLSEEDVRAVLEYFRKL